MKGGNKMANTHIASNFKVLKGECEDERFLVDADTGEIILQGDYYHDKIESMIKGFREALDFFGYSYEWEEVV